MKRMLKPTIVICLLFVMIHHCRAQYKSIKDMAYYLNNAPFKMPAVTEPQFAARTFNVMDYGAVADGQVLNTDAFVKAIGACSSAGGGTVLVPPGLYLTGPIELKSNINFHVDRGALIIFSSDHSLFPLVDGKTKWPLSGTKLENVAITGEGVFDGAGDTWRPLKKSKAAPTLWNELVKGGGELSKDGTIWWPTGQVNEHLRPVLCVISNSKNILVDGPTFKNSPNFAFNPKNCTNLIVRNVHINNEYYAQNGDAMDISACKNVIVYHCTINAGDDGICMKSSGNKNAGTAGLENVIIADNIVYHAHGGFVVGSNTDGGMNNIWVTNCNFVNTDVGIRIKSSRDRGGLVHNVFIDHIFMHDILNEAILFSTYYEDGGPDAEKGSPVAVTDKTPIFRDFHMSNIYCNNAKTAVSIVGLPEMAVSHLDFTDITISAGRGFVATEATDISTKNLKIISPDKTVYSLTNVSNINISNASYSSTADVFVSVNGAKTDNVTISGTALKLPNALKFGIGVSKSAVVVK